MTHSLACPIATLSDRAIARFWSHVTRGGVGECWTWDSRHDRDGYATFSVGKTHYKASRVVWHLVYRPLPTSVVIDHRCRNRACVNPSHLELTTHEVNTWRGAGRYWSDEGLDILLTVIRLPELVPTPKVAGVLRLHPTTVLRLCQSGKLPRVTGTYHRRYVRRADLVQFVLARAYADAGLALLEALNADQQAA